MINRRRIVPLLLTAALGLAASLPASNAAAQTQRSAATEVAATDLARVSDTTRDDLRLINRCIDDGGGKQECLCVTQVLKYEMTLADYRRAARLYAIPAKIQTRGRQADYSIGQDQAAEVVTRDIRGMVDAPNFEYRCNDARRYFDRMR